MIEYRCPVCAQKHLAPETAAGARHECTACGQRVQVPPLDLGLTTLHQASQPTTAQPRPKTRVGKMERPWREEEVPEAEVIDEGAQRRGMGYWLVGILVGGGGALLFFAVLAWLLMNIPWHIRR